MAGVQLAIFATLLTYSTAQIPVQGFFSVPATAFNRGGQVNFAGLSLGQICKEIMLLGGKEALPDGMGMAAKWLSNRNIASHIAGGADPRMQCLYSQATGGIVPGSVGARDPANMFGDYYDTVIEYPIIVDPCTAPQCDGKVNPTALLLQAYAPMMLGGMRGMGGIGAGFGVGMTGATGAATNPFATLGQNSFLSALMPQQNQAKAGSAAVVNATVPTSSGAAAPVTPDLAAPTQTLKTNRLVNAWQTPPTMHESINGMLQQLLMQSFLRNSGQTGANPNTGAASFPAFSPFGNGYPGIGSLFL